MCMIYYNVHSIHVIHNHIYYRDFPSTKSRQSSSTMLWDTHWSSLLSAGSVATKTPRLYNTSIKLYIVLYMYIQKSAHYNYLVSGSDYLLGFNHILHIMLSLNVVNYFMYVQHVQCITIILLYIVCCKCISIHT